MNTNISRPQRLMVVIGLSSCFFLTEISIGLYTHSLALVADAFHYLNDLMGFTVALLALKITETESTDAAKALAFGWQRAPLLGAFFNGALLFALGIGIVLQSLERFIWLHEIENPKVMLIVGCVGLGLNVVSAMVLHERHTHHYEEVLGPLPSESSMEPKTNRGMAKRGSRPASKARIRFSCHDLGMMGPLLHVVGDAANNLGVIIAALVIWLTHYKGRYYADPGVSIGIAIMLTLSSLPLLRRSGLLLLGSAPPGVDSNDIKNDLEKIPGVSSIQALHVFYIHQHKALAIVSLVVSDQSTLEFTELTRRVNACFQKYNIHSVALQPDIALAGIVTVPDRIGPEDSEENNR